MVLNPQYNAISKRKISLLPFSTEKEEITEKDRPNPEAWLCAKKHSVVDGY